jgi:ACS family sodium-dependent inorganic phosphate cotransporter
MATSGAWIGNIIALPLGSFLCVSGFDDGWPSIFYIFGILSAIWCILFFILTSDSPQTHRFATQIEKDYVISHVKKSANLVIDLLETSTNIQF